MIRFSTLLVAGLFSLTGSSAFALQDGDTAGSSGGSIATDCANADGCRYSFSLDFASPPLLPLLIDGSDFNYLGSPGPDRLTGSFVLDVNELPNFADPDVVDGSGQPILLNAIRDAQLFFEREGEEPVSLIADNTQNFDGLWRQANGALSLGGISIPADVVVIQAQGLPDGLLPPGFDSAFLGIGFNYFSGVAAPNDLTQFRGINPIIGLPGVFGELLFTNDEYSLISGAADGSITDSVILSTTDFLPLAAPTIVVNQTPPDPEDPCDDIGLGINCTTLEESVGGVIPAPAAPFGLALIGLLALHQARRVA